MFLEEPFLYNHYSCLYEDNRNVNLADLSVQDRVLTASNDSLKILETASVTSTFLTNVFFIIEVCNFTELHDAISH